MVVLGEGETEPSLQTKLLGPGSRVQSLFGFTRERRKEEGREERRKREEEEGQGRREEEREGLKERGGWRRMGCSSGPGQAGQGAQGHPHHPESWVLAIAREFYGPLLWAMLNKNKKSS